MRTLLACCVLATAALLLSGTGRAPLAASPDELRFAQAVRSLGDTGQDLRGHHLPLYVQVDDTRWLPPLPVYVAVLFARVSGGTTGARHWPQALFATLDILLIYFVARRSGLREGSAATAAVLLLLTPAHIIHGGIAYDGVITLPFLLGWLLCLLTFLERREAGWLGLGGLLLGIGFYSHTAAPIQMTACALITVAALARCGHGSGRAQAIAAGGFVLPLLAVLPWFIAHPASYIDTLGQWLIHPAHIRNPVDGLRAFVHWGTLTNRTSIYWAMLNPAYLFLPVDAGSPEGTPWILLTPLGILIPAGIHALVAHERPASLPLLAGLATAPAAAALFGEPGVLSRALVLLPFASLIAACGLDALWARPSKVVRAATGGLLLLAALQFAYFTRTTAWPAATAGQAPAALTASRTR